MTRHLLTLYNVAGYIFLFAPIAIVLVLSFSAGANLAFPPPGLSLRWFRYLAGRDEFLRSALVSIEIATLASLGSLALGLPAAFAIVRHRFPGKALMEALLMSPLTLPGIITGIALLQYFTVIGLIDSFARLVVAHVIVCTPYAIRSLTASLHGIDPSFEEASQTLGASRATTFVKVLLPLLRPGVFAALVFSFVTSFDNVVVSIYLIGADTVTLPIRILTYVEWQFDPSIAAISAIFIAVTTLVVIATELLPRMRARDTMSASMRA